MRQGRVITKFQYGIMAVSSTGYLVSLPSKTLQLTLVSHAAEQTASEIRLEKTDYTYAVGEIIGTATTVGKAFALSFLSDCPEIGVVSTFRPYAPAPEKPW
jgi:hypothetical protein